MVEIDDFWLNIKIEGMFNDANTFLRATTRLQDGTIRQKLGYPEELYYNNSFGSYNYFLKSIQQRLESTYTSMTTKEKFEFSKKVRLRKESAEKKMADKNAVNSDQLKKLYELCDFMQDIIRYYDNGQEITIEL